MQYKPLSRRQFLIKTSKSIAYTAVGSSVLTTVNAARPNTNFPGKNVPGKGRIPGKLLNQVLGFRVNGVERNNKIADRLATNLIRLQNSEYEELLNQATLATYDLQRAPGGSGRGRPTVTKNLNLLLEQVYSIDGGSSVSQQLARAILTTTLFATHGVHHPSTRAAQQDAREATRDLKDRNSSIPRAERLAAKQSRQALYRSEVGLAVDGYPWLPEIARIPSVWIMPRYLVG